MFFRAKNKKEVIRNLFISGIILLILLFLIFKVDILYNSIGIRVIQMLSYFFDTKIGVDPSTVSRMNFLKDSWDVFLKNPILGIGIGGYKYVNNYEFVWAENTVLELLADVGIVGTCIYYYLHFEILKSVIKRIKKRNDFDVQIIVIFVCLIFIDLTMVSYYNYVLQFYLAFIYSENYIAKKEYEVHDEEK